MNKTSMLIAAGVLAIAATDASASTAACVAMKKAERIDDVSFATELARISRDEGREAAELRNQAAAPLRVAVGGGEMGRKPA